MNPPFRVTSPWHGDVLNCHDGDEVADSLAITVVGTAPASAEVTVNGAAASMRGGSFHCPLALREHRTDVVVVCRVGGVVQTETVTVLWDRASRPRYRFSVDDNIHFLKELGTRPDRYPSLFEHWYLSFWRQMHDQFGARIHINIYYQTVEGDFTIAQMPEKWRAEWEANSDWLHLSFHALQHKPDWPYERATYGQMARDFDLVMAEIRRFAGEVVTTDTTTIHWASAPKDACRALHDRGIRALIGIFRREYDGECLTGYYLPDTVKDHVNERDAWYDPEADLLFVTEDATINSLHLDEVVPWLERQAANPHTAQLMELLIHEQYFRSELPVHQPDIQEKVVRALRWVTDRGYEPVFWGSGFLGNNAGVR